MNEMIERVAQALFEDWLTQEDVVQDQAQNGPHPPWAGQSQYGRDPWLTSARAAIKAMREPTGLMLDAYWFQTGESNEMRSRVHSRAVRYYGVMIDAALAD